MPSHLLPWSTWADVLSNWHRQQSRGASEPYISERTLEPCALLPLEWATPHVDGLSPFLICIITQLDICFRTLFAPHLHAVLCLLLAHPHLRRFFFCTLTIVDLTTNLLTELWARSLNTRHLPTPPLSFATLISIAYLTYIVQQLLPADSDYGCCS